MSRKPTHVTREFDPRVTVEYYSVTCGEIQCQTFAASIPKAVKRGVRKGERGRWTGHIGYRRYNVLT